MEMTLHRALALKKTTLARIDDEISKDEDFVTVEVGDSGKTMSNIKTSIAEKNIRARYDKINQLIKNYIDINCAISAANAGITNTSETKAALEYNGRKYSLTDMIQLKPVFVRRKRLLDILEGGYNNTLRIIARKNDKVEEDVNAMISNMTGGDKNKPSGDEIKNITEAYNKSHVYNLVDPLGIASKLTGMKEDLIEFETTVDSRISELNAITKINVDL